MRREALQMKDVFVQGGGLVYPEELLGQENPEAFGVIFGWMFGWLRGDLWMRGDFCVVWADF